MEMHVQSNPADKDKEPIRFVFDGTDRLVRDIGSRERTKLTKELTELLEKANYTGNFTLYMQTYIPGSPHTQGLQLGMPVENGRNVELRWQEGGNDTRFKLFMSVPHGVDVFDFHKQLDQAITGQGEKPMNKSQAVVRKSDPNLVRFPQQLSPTKKEVKTLDQPKIEFLMRELHNTSPTVSLFTRADSTETLLLLGEEEPDETLAKLLQGGHLVPLEGSDEMLGLSEHWQTTLKGGATTSSVKKTEVEKTTTAKREKAVSEPVAVVSSPQPSTPSFAHAGIFAPKLDLLSELKSLRATRDQHAALKKTFDSISGEIRQIETPIAAQLARLKTLYEQRSKIQESLDSEEMAQALGLLQEVEKLLSAGE